MLNLLVVLMNVAGSLSVVLVRLVLGGIHVYFAADGTCCYVPWGLGQFVPLKVLDCLVCEVGDKKVGIISLGRGMRTLKLSSISASPAVVTRLCRLCRRSSGGRFGCFGQCNSSMVCCDRRCLRRASVRRLLLGSMYGRVCWL